MIYRFNFSGSIQIKDVKDENEAINYFEDILLALNEILVSSDENDDHYGEIDFRSTGYTKEND